MTPRKELFIAIQNALKQIPQLELIDLQRKQFSDLKNTYGNYFTAALIGIKSIQWSQMVEQRQEGTCTVEIILYTKDGWLDQHNTTSDPDNGLTELDLQDEIIEQTLFLQGESFKPIMLVSEAPEDEDSEMLSYKMTFSTMIYRVIKPRYQNKVLTAITPA